MELKKTEITDRVKESVEQNGKKPELFGDIVTAAIALLERLIAKVMQKVMDFAGKVVGKTVDAVKESPKEMERSECTGIFKGGRRKELQQEISEIDIQISNMKKRLSSIVKEYKFDSVQAFYKEFNAAKREYLDYKTARVGWEKIYGDKVTNPKSIREQLRQKEQMVKEREAGRDYWTRRKDKGAR